MKMENINHAQKERNLGTEFIWLETSTTEYSGGGAARNSQVL